MNAHAILHEILAGHSPPPEIWETPEMLWAEIQPPISHKEKATGDPNDTWTLLQAILFSRKLTDVPEHINLVEHCHPKSKDTLLHWAARWGFSQETSLLLTMGADPNQKNAAGETPKDLGKSEPVQLVFKKHQEDARREKARQVIKDIPTPEI